MAKKKDKPIPVPQDEPKLVKELRAFVNGESGFFMLNKEEAKAILHWFQGDGGL